MSFALHVDGFQNLGDIPSVYTCEGRDISPKISWDNPPQGTMAFVLIMDDPDAPDPKAPKMTWVHWVLYNIPATAHEIEEAVSPSALPKGTLEGVNNWGRTRYGGPCPPIGKHRYFFKLYALSQPLASMRRPTKEDIERGMEGLILGKAEVIGLYQKNAT